MRSHRLFGLVRVQRLLHGLLRRGVLPGRVREWYRLYDRGRLYDLLVALRGAGRESTNSPRP